MRSDWVLLLAMDWGKAMRAFDRRAGNVSGNMGRIFEEGEGAVIRGAYHNPPNAEFYGEIKTFDNSWRDLDGGKRAILYLDFVLRNQYKAPERWAIAEMSKSNYYRLRGEALDEIRSNFHLYQPSNI